MKNIAGLFSSPFSRGVLKYDGPRTPGCNVVLRVIFQFFFWSSRIEEAYIRLTRTASSLSSCGDERSEERGGWPLCRAVGLLLNTARHTSNSELPNPPHFARDTHCQGLEKSCDIVQDQVVALLLKNESKQ